MNNVVTSGAKAIDSRRRSSQNNIRIHETRWMRSAEHVTRIGEMRNETTFWLENLKGRNHSIKSKLQIIHDEINRRLNSGNALSPFGRTSFIFCFNIWKLKHNIL
jgi:hypothetical protein